MGDLENRMYSDSAPERTAETCAQGGTQANGCSTSQRLQPSSVIDDEERRYARKWLVLLSCSMALCLVMLDASVVNVSLPQISEDLHASAQQSAWFINAYSLILAAFLLTGGRLGDLWGKKTTFMAGIALFMVGSLTCACSFHPMMLILARMVQGLGAACLMPATITLLMTHFPIEQRGMAIGIWGVVSGVSVAIGPVLGGYLTDTYGWPLIFLINLPLGGAALALSWYAIVKQHRTFSGHLDAPALFITVMVLSMLSLLITHVDLGHQTALFITATCVCGLLVGLLYWWETSYAISPIFAFELVRDRSFVAGAGCGCILMFVQMAIFFVLPTYLQQAGGLSATQSGAYIMPLAIAMLVVTPIAGTLSDRIGSKPLLVAGMCISATSVGVLTAFLYLHHPAHLVIMLALIGGGLGLVQAPLTSAVMSAVPPQLEGTASGMNSTARQMGSLMGVSAMAALVSQGISIQLCFLVCTLLVGVVLALCMRSETNVEAYARKRQIHDRS